MSAKWFASCLFVLVATAASPVRAQSTLGYGATILIPLVAKTASYETEVFVGNFGTTDLTIGVTLIEGTTSSVPGKKACTPLTLPASANGSMSSASFTIGTQCSIPTGGHFGMLILSDASAEAVNGFFAYSRTQNPQSIGFSVEGFPAGAVSAQSVRLNGLKRALPPAATPFQSNCFVGSFDKPVDYIIRLRDTTGASVGAVSGHLDAFQLIRYLDIFLAAGHPTGDFSNVSAQFNTTNASTPGNHAHPLFVGFCTVQDNVSFGADFRIGKAINAFDESHAQIDGACTPATCGAYDYALPDASKMQAFAFFVRPPDAIRCDLLSDRLDDLQIQLRDPTSVGDCDLCGLPAGSTAGPTTPGTVVAGGANLTGFYYETGSDVIRPSDGGLLRAFWSLEVSARSKVPPPAGPIPYSISCVSGNGIMHDAPVTRDVGP